MEAPDSLHRLIASLSEEEYLYCLQYLPQTKLADNVLYWEPLMQTIRRAPNYESINLQSIVLANGYTAPDNDCDPQTVMAGLYNHLLCLLQNYTSTAQPLNIDAQLSKEIGYIASLYEKGLYEEALIRTLKGQLMAISNEKLAYVPLFVYWNKRIAEIQGYKGINESELKELCQLEQKNLAKLHDINEYWLLQAQLYYQYHHNGIVRSPHDIDRIGDIFGTSSLGDEDKTSSFEARLLLYKVYGTYFFMVRDFTNCYKYGKKMVEWLEAHPKLMRIDLLSYINAVNNLLNMCSVMGKTEEREYYLLQLRTMLDDKTLYMNDAVRIKLFEAYYYHQMTYYLGRNQFEEGVKCVAEMEQTLRFLDRRLDRMGRVMLCFYSFHLCFGAGHYADAHRWLQIILAQPPKEVRQDIYDFAQILSLLTAYELHNSPLLKQTTKSVYKHLYHKIEKSAFEKLVMSFLRNTTHRNNGQLNGAFVELLAQLELIANDNFEKKAFAFFDFPKWVYAQTVGQAFGELVKSQ